MKRFVHIVVLILGIATADIASAQRIFLRGTGEYVYTGYEPLSDKPITVRYHIPLTGDVKDMDVLFVMHGSGRNSKSPLNAWKPFADNDGFIIIAPEYSKTYYSQREYNYGNVSGKTSSFEPQPEELWTFHTIEAIFDFFREDTGNTSNEYDMWGHSAGGQFVHRFLICMPHARVRKAVAANCGTYAFPLEEGLTDKDGVVYSWPFSLSETPFADEEYLRPYFARQLYISLGTSDTDTSKDDFPDYPSANAQGENRYERGNNFFKTSGKVAKQHKYPFNWKKVDVDKSGHSVKMMVYGAYQTVDGKKVYTPDNVTRTSGYWLIRKK